MLGISIKEQREEKAWTEGVAIWVAILVVSLVGAALQLSHSCTYAPFVTPISVSSPTTEEVINSALCTCAMLDHFTMPCMYLMQFFLRTLAVLHLGHDSVSHSCQVAGRLLGWPAASGALHWTQNTILGILGMQSRLLGEEEACMH